MGTPPKIYIRILPFQKDHAITYEKIIFLLSFDVKKKEEVLI